jgi:hypothetical protein
MTAEVFFGDAKKPLPDWRAALPEETDSDSESPTEEQVRAVTAIIGFDPMQESPLVKSPPPPAAPPPA